MSNSYSQNSAKPKISGSTTEYKFHANSEELEELHLEKQESKDISSDSIVNLNDNLNSKITLLPTENSEILKSEIENIEGSGDSVKDCWNSVGKRSVSVDLNYESPFSNPFETWRKLNELKVKITKTVEEKISEMKIDCNVLNKSGGDKLLHSKENSSISDSEDTSESSKLSEKWKDAEDFPLHYCKISNETTESLSSILETAVENVKMEMENREAVMELKNRKRSNKLSDIIKLSDIKIATAKSEIEKDFLEESLIGEVESGVEADENLDPTETDSIDVFDDATISSGEGSQTPPGGNNIHFRLLNFCSSIIFSQSITFALIVGVGFYVFLPLPDFIKGFFLCFLLMALWKKFRNFMEGEKFLLSQKSFVLPDYKALPPLKVPHYKPVKGVWINEYEKELYNPEYYSVSQTVPAYLEITDSFLKLSRPKGKIRKRATYDEPEYKLHFISERIYNINGCNIFLMPEGLTRKRLFSKKYPIVIFLKPNSLVSEKKKGKEIDEKESQEGAEAEVVDLTSHEPTKNKSSLYLFARCDRQKEEWYRRLLAASKHSSPSQTKNDNKAEVIEEKESSDENTPKETSTSFENLFFDDEATQTEEYLRYMAKFVDIEVIHHAMKSIKSRISWYKKFKTKKKDTCMEDEVDHIKTVAVNNVIKKGKSSRSSVNLDGNEDNDQEEISHPTIQTQWFNAFINRILFDVFRSPYWLRKIQDKVEKKLNSIRLPYYIEDIEVIELDLGKMGPTFHRVSQPYLDERGLWFDMDTTFDGLIKLTIQTYLNLIKLQKGLEEDNGGTHLHDKPKKGKKRHKEMKDTSIIKDSRKENSKENLNRNHKKFGESRSKSPSIEENSELLTVKNSGSHPELEYVTSHENKLIDELAQFAELAMKESLSSVNKRSPIYDSDLEDSAESSDEDDEEEEEILLPTSPPPEPQEQIPIPTSKRYPKNRRSSKKIFRVFENVAQSKYFKSVAQSKYIRKAIAGVSATKLRLTLELKSCTGVLVVNIPPPPSDRFWYGFREMPNLIFSANPKIGDKVLRFAHIQNYLQKKILREIKKVMVSPNMIDFILPTSSPPRSSSSQEIDLPDLDDQEQTPSE